jgi:hypothetical protein
LGAQEQENGRMEEQAIVASEASVEFVGRWQRLVSTTNWEKGRIIFEWRQALCGADAPATSFTDEAWSRQVGNVTPQHVGRLRRVYERFGGVFEQYPGLYWSHFFAALDWPDAEMYLEGAVHSRWSVPDMRRQRWEASGAPAEMAAADSEAASFEIDDDAACGGDGFGPPTISESYDEVHAAVAADETLGPGRGESDDADAPADAAAATRATGDPPVRPFEALPELPPDVAEAMELFKLAILAHKVAGWRDIARNDLLAVLDSLRQLALAPAG